MKLIIDIDEKWKAKCSLFSSIEELNYLCDIIQNGTPIPDNATNGDVVKTLFSNTFDNFCERTTWEWNRWWNAPYRKAVRNDK